MRDHGTNCTVMRFIHHPAGVDGAKHGSFGSYRVSGQRPEQATKMQILV